MDIAQRMDRATEMATMANKGIGDTTDRPRRRLNIESGEDNRCNIRFLPRAQLKSVVSMTMTGAMGIWVVLGGHAEGCNESQQRV
jgi:hypothetical protein